MQRENEKQLYRKNELIYISLALLLLGAFLSFVPDTDAGTVCRFGGVLLCIGGALRIVSYFTAPGTQLFGSFQLVQGVAVVGFGIFVLVRAEWIAQLLIVLFGMILLTDCVFKLQYAIDLFRLSHRCAKLLLAGAAISLVLGILILVLASHLEDASIALLAGVSLLYAGISDLAVIWLVNRIWKKTVLPRLEQGDREMEKAQ